MGGNFEYTYLYSKLDEKIYLNIEYGDVENCQIADNVEVNDFFSVYSVISIYFTEQS